MLFGQRDQAGDQAPAVARDPDQGVAAVVAAGGALHMALRLQAQQQPRDGRLLAHGLFGQHRDAHGAVACQGRQHAPLQHRQPVLLDHRVELGRNQVPGPAEEGRQVIVDKRLGSGHALRCLVIRWKQRRFYLPLPGGGGPIRPPRHGQYAPDSNEPKPGTLVSRPSRLSIR